MTISFRGFRVWGGGGDGGVGKGHLVTEEFDNSINSTTGGALLGDNNLLSVAAKGLGVGFISQQLAGDVS